MLSYIPIFYFWFRHKKRSITRVLRVALNRQIHSYIEDVVAACRG